MKEIKVRVSEVCFSLDKSSGKGESVLGGDPRQRNPRDHISGSSGKS